MSMMLIAALLAHSVRTGIFFGCTPRRLGDLDSQHAVPERGADPVGVEILGEGERPVVVGQLELLVVGRAGRTLDASVDDELVALGHDVEAAGATPGMSARRTNAFSVS